MEKKKLTKKEKELMLAQLSEMIPEYGKKNDTSKTIKKELDNWNGQIKNIMSTLEMSDFQSEDYNAKYEVRVSKNMNEDKLLAFFTSSKKLRDKAEELGIIKTKEYIDGEAVSKAIYNQCFDKKTILEMEKCEDVKSTQYLTVSKNKKKEV